MDDLPPDPTPTALFGDLLVIDCASFIAGPAAATVMGDLGARVIKIEPPGLGDSYRALFRLRGEAEGALDYYWNLSSRNKESLALDLKDGRARAVLDTLIRRADVFITNYPFGVRERLRLRAEDVTPLNRRLIYASLTPYGESGPERDRTAYDTTAWWARSGLMDMVKPAAGAEPGFSTPGMGDHPTAMALYGAIVTALCRRQRTGEGGIVASSLLANGLWSNGCQVQAALLGYELSPRVPRGERGALTDIYGTKDGRTFILAIVNPTQEWPRLAASLGKAEWLDDPRFATPAARFANTVELSARLGAIFSAETFDHWRDHLARAGVTFGIVARLADHAGDPQIAANALLPAFADGAGLRTVDSPFQIAGEVKQAPRLAPNVGEHTRAILAECGLAPGEIDALAPPG